MKKVIPFILITLLLAGCEPEHEPMPIDEQPPAILIDEEPVKTLEEPVATIEQLLPPEEEGFMVECSYEEYYSIILHDVGSTTIVTNIDGKIKELCFAHDQTYITDRDTYYFITRGEVIDLVDVEMFDTSLPVTFTTPVTEADFGDSSLKSVDTEVMYDGEIYMGHVTTSDFIHYNSITLTSPSGYTISYSGLPVGEGDTSHYDNNERYALIDPEHGNQIVLRHFGDLMLVLCAGSEMNDGELTLGFNTQYKYS